MREDDTAEVELEGGEPIWHVAVAAGQTQGPYTAGELSGLRAGGTIQDSMLVWREGWEDWRPLGEVEEILLAPALEMGVAAQAGDDGSNGFDVSVSMGDDPFAGDSGPPPGPASTLAGYAAPPAVCPSGAQAPAPLASAGGNETPVSMGADPFATGESPAQDPRVSAAAALTPGQAREDTVQIDLGALSRLSLTTTAATTGLAQATGAAREDSGLIDVRKVAEASSEVAASGAAARGSYEVIGIPTGTGLEAPRKPLTFRAKLALSVGAFGGVLLLVVVAVALTRDAPGEPALAAEDGVATGAEAAPALVTPAAADPAADDEPAEAAPEEERADEPEASADGADEDEEEEAVEDGADERKVSKRKRRTARTRRTASAAPRRTTPSKSSGGDSIDDLLGRALEGGSKRSTSKARASASSSLANTPTRDQVLTAMNGVKGKVGACGDSGVATVKMSVSGSTGRVSSASASGVSGSVKSCVERAVRSARFPKFKQSTFSVSYPFRL